MSIGDELKRVGACAGRPRGGYISLDGPALLPHQPLGSMQNETLIHRDLRPDDARVFAGDPPTLIRGDVCVCKHCNLLYFSPCTASKETA
jgi:hypothetical protein